MRARIAIVAAVAILIVVRAASPSSSGYPLVSVAQGVSALDLGGDRIFVARQGTLTIDAFPARSPLGAALVWCPREAFFVSPEKAELFTLEGVYVAGPSPRDMDRHPVQVVDGALVVDTGRVVKAEGRGEGEVSGEAGQMYERWRSAPSEPIGFCQDPVR